MHPAPSVCYDTASVLEDCCWVVTLSGRVIDPWWFKGESLHSLTLEVEISNKILLYLVRTQQIAYYQPIKLATCFSSTSHHQANTQTIQKVQKAWWWLVEPSSGQFTNHIEGMFSRCAHCGIPQCAHLLNVPSVWFVNWPDDGSLSWNMLPVL